MVLSGHHCSGKHQIEFLFSYTESRSFIKENVNYFNRTKTHITKIVSGSNISSLTFSNKGGGFCLMQNLSQTNQTLKLVINIL